MNLGNEDGTNTGENNERSVRHNIDYAEPNQMIDFTNEESSPEISNTDNIT